MRNDPPEERTSEESEQAREARRILETTPEGPRIPQSSTATGDGESGTGDYGVELGAGGHRGFGPTDDAVSARAELGKLLEAAGLGSTEIDVRITDGTATLEGTVEDLQQKQQAEEIVRRAPGVDDVENKLRVRG